MLGEKTIVLKFMNFTGNPTGVSRGGDIEDSSWVRVQDKDTFSRRVTGRPSDEGARSARNEQGKNILILHEDT